MDVPRESRKKHKIKSMERSPEQIDQRATKTGQKRGRPRVEKRDANAIERRRTQIRVAQRAYRARKDSTIIDLQTQVNTLRSELQDATTNLQIISDKLAIDDDRLAARADLHATITRLTELHRTVETIKNDPSPDNDETPLQQSIESEVLPLVPHSGGIPYAENMGSLTRSADDYIFRSEPESTYTSATNTALRETDTTWNNPFQKAIDFERPGEVFARSSPSAIQIPPLVTVVPTFSWQETTFARRLMRHSHEMCLRHLENPSEKYALMLNRARYSLTFMSEEALIQKLKNSVAKSKVDPLEDWSMPILHVGGAGKHSEWSSGEEGNKRQFVQDRNMGPFQVPSAAFPIPTSLFPDKVAEWLGLDGVWLDHCDVEAYLRSKGLKLDSAASTTTLEISTLSESWPDAGGNSSDLWVNYSSSTTSELLDFMQLPIKSSPIIGHRKSQSLTRRAAEDDPSTKQLILSVDRLIEELNEQAVCLGRAPGYRQSDVDTALKKVLDEARDSIAV